ncbi:Sigma-70, region 4 [Frankineae bacterium MT45]|nr:Sigma-70, region 4 [Frankineae bacterium MT45]
MTPGQQPQISAGRDAARRVTQAVAGLPHGQAAVVRLSYLHGLSHLQIAASAGVSLAEVRALAAEALHTIGLLLRDQDPRELSLPTA